MRGNIAARPSSDNQTILLESVTRLNQLGRTTSLEAAENQV